MFSFIILVRMLSFLMVFEETRVLIRYSILCCATPLNEKLGLVSLCFIIAMILWCCSNFSIIFSKESWICSTLTNRSSLHCKPRDETIFAKKLLNVSTTRLLSNSILVLSSISVILFLTLLLNGKNGLTVCQKRLLSTIFFVSRLLKKDFFSLRKRDAQ